jgi:hypothetical protein
MRNWNSSAPLRTRQRPGFSTWLLVILALAFGLAACQTRNPVLSPGQITQEPGVSTSPNLVVPPTQAATNEQRQVTYTFDLPRPAASGYIIQESSDGVTWADLGRSTSTKFTRVTFVDSTPSSGKRYRVVLP